MATYNAYRQPGRPGARSNSETDGPHQRITSAYNFVPLQDRVVEPDWQDRTSQDLPLQDGLCAELDISITNDTPLLVGGSRGERTKGQAVQVEFSRHPDGCPVIPGSSLRGAIRNVLEIATSSQMARIDDRKLSVRDLDNKDLYNRHLTLSEGRDPVKVTPLTRTAWMRFNKEAGGWEMCHVPHVRVEHHDLKSRLGLDLQGWFKRTNDRTPHGKYRHVQAHFAQEGSSGHPPLQLFFSIKEAKEKGPHEHRGGTLSISYSRVKDVTREPQAGGSGYADGRLVVTGQPSNKKHMEFIFQTPTAKPVWFALGERLVQDFLRIHDTPETLLGLFRSDKNPFGDEIGFPVFYLCRDKLAPKALNSDDILAIGLSQMFRLPYAHSIGDAARRHQPPPAAGRLDFARTLFGCVEDELPGPEGGEPPREASRRGRVSFGDCRLAGFQPGSLLDSWLAPQAFQNPTVLNGPKPSYYPNYIEQKTSKADPGQVEGAYRTLMDEDARLRGWKRYPVHAPAEVRGVPAPPDKSGSDVQTRLRPLRAGLSFTGRVRLHNVTREELGAVLWALTWGGDTRLRHALGMGRPFGLGQVRIELRNVSIRPNDPAVSAPTEKDCRAAFEAWMRRQDRDWDASVKELLAMADPAAPGTASLAPLRLGMGGDNEFKLAKQSRSALPPYSRMRKAR